MRWSAGDVVDRACHLDAVAAGAQRNQAVDHEIDQLLGARHAIVEVERGRHASCVVRTRKRGDLCGPLCTSATAAELAVETKTLIVDGLAVIPSVADVGAIGHRSSAGDRLRRCAYPAESMLPLDGNGDPESIHSPACFRRRPMLALLRMARGATRSTGSAHSQRRVTESPGQRQRKADGGTS
jgi:hypothetical protein